MCRAARGCPQRAHLNVQPGAMSSENTDTYHSHVAIVFPKVFVLNCKLSIKKLTDKNGLKILPKFEKMYAKFKEKGLKIYAYTASKLIHTYNHECISNILNAAGVRAN